MPRPSAFAYVLMISGLLLASSRAAPPQDNFRQLTGKEFESALPKDFYLEGNAIPTEKRNAALLKGPSGARLLFALLDTSGYSSQIQQKYIGMMINEGATSICGNAVAVGSYGFGLVKPQPGGAGGAAFNLYNQAGEKVAGCAATPDTAIRQPKPLQVVVSKNGPARLYLGRYWLEFR
jgi:hypothetical protein